MKSGFFILTGVLLFAAPSYAQLITRDSAPEEKPAPEKKLDIAAHFKAPEPATHSGIPLEITADNTLEWQRNEKTFTASGNALARQGDMSVAANTLTAYYTDKTGGGMDISRVVASENVVIKSKDSQAYGASADYDLVKGYAVMTGENLRMVSPDQTVTANEKFEYWVKDGKLTAVGRARAVRGNDALEADTIAAVLKNDAQGKRALDTLEATGHVVITTPTETATGSYAIYRAAADKAELKGNVQIKRGLNTLQGERAEIDLATNTSRLFGGAGSGTGQGRVRGVFYPGSGKKP